MTREEAKGFIQGKLDCMNMCDVFECKGTDECDSCDYCYSQGNFGEQKKAFEMAIEVLGNDTNVGNKWIPCSELPKTNGVYQITRKIQVGDFVHYIVTCAYFDGHNQWHNDNGVNSARKYLKDVIAWQPLPEPYKEGET